MFVELFLVLANYEFCCRRQNGTSKLTRASALFETYFFEERTGRHGFNLNIETLAKGITAKLLAVEARTCQFQGILVLKNGHFTN
jgi:hypothetical protein